MKYTREVLVLLAAAAIGFVSSQVLGQTTTSTIVSELAKEKASLLTVGITTLNLIGAGSGQGAAFSEGKIVISRVKTANSPEEANAAACARVLADIRTTGNVNSTTGEYRGGVNRSSYSQHFVQVELRETPAGTTRMQEIDRQIVVSAMVRDRNGLVSQRCSGRLMSTEAN